MLTKVKTIKSLGSHIALLLPLRNYVVLSVAISDP